MNLFKKLGCILISCALIMTMTSCSSSKVNMNNSKADSSTSEDKRDESGAEDFGTTNNSSSNPSIENNQKIIKRASVTVETTNFDESIEKINNEITKLGGYLESSSTEGFSITNRNRNRRSDITIRIPSKSFETFMNGLHHIGYVPHQDISTENVTSQYMDTEARLKSLKVQEERLLDLLKQGKELKDILEIESQLSNVRYQIESYTGNLKHWDNLVNYSTITLYVQEVDEILIEASKPKTLGEKIIVGFERSVENIIEFSKGMIIFVVSCIPYLIILIPVILIIRYIFKKKNIFKDKK